MKLFEEEFKIAVELTTSTLKEKIAGFQGVTLFRIIQEALYNIGKHSRAGRAKVEIWMMNREVLVVIEDDGVGFDAGRTLWGNERLIFLVWCL